MTAQYKSKVFKAGNSAAVRLPKDTAFALGTEITIERQGDTVTIKPAVDREAGKRRVQAMIAALDALPPVTRFQEREPFEAPERDGWI